MYSVFCEMCSTKMHGLLKPNILLSVEDKQACTVISCKLQICFLYGRGLVGQDHIL